MDDLYDDFGNYIGPELVEYGRAPAAGLQPAGPASC